MGGAECAAPPSPHLQTPAWQVLPVWQSLVCAQVSPVKCARLAVKVRYAEYASMSLVTFCCTLLSAPPTVSGITLAPAGTSGCEGLIAVPRQLPRNGITPQPPTMAS